MQGFLQGHRGRVHAREQGSGGRLQGFLNDLVDAFFLRGNRGFGLPVFGPLALGGALGVLRGPLLGNNLFRGHRHFFLLVRTHDLGDIGPEPTLFDHNDPAVGGVHAQLPARLGGGEEFLGELQRELVRGGGVGKVSALEFGFPVRFHPDLAFQVGAVPAHPHIDGSALVVVEKRQGVDHPRINLLQVIAHQRFQATLAGDGFGGGVGGVLVAEIEPLEPVRTNLVTCGNVVELILHGGREIIVHQGGE